MTQGPWPFAAAALLLGIAALTASPALPPAARAHLFLAVGLLPLILAAMLHFAPVLCRTAAPGRWHHAPPLLAMAGGAALVAFLAFGLPTLGVALLLAFAAAAWVLGWVRVMARAAFGAPHPSLRWYRMALFCLLVALAAMGVALFVPAEWRTLRLLHLHLNLFGFVALTALGTLWVLLPTAAGYAEPQAGERLRRDLVPALAGSVLLAVGAALWWPLSLLGTLLWGYALGRFLWRGWLRRGELRGAARALYGAALGLLLNLLLGAAHAAGLLPATGATAGYLIGFLLPLVSGAAGHLLPMWRWPGPATPAREAARVRLAHLAGTRTALLVGAGVAAGVGITAGVWLGAAVTALFLLQVAWALRAPAGE